MYFQISPATGSFVDYTILLNARFEWGGFLYMKSPLSRLTKTGMKSFALGAKPALLNLVHIKHVAEPQVFSQKYDI